LPLSIQFVADDETRRSILEVVAVGAGLQRAEVVELIRDPERLGVGVVLVGAADVAVVVDGVAVDQDVARDVGIRGAHEEAVAAVVNGVVADRDVLALLDPDCRSIRRVALGRSRIIGKRVRRTRAAHIEVLDDDVLWHGVGGNARAANLDDRAIFSPVVERQPRRPRRCRR
jgi:hypothetical protein